MTDISTIATMAVLAGGIIYVSAMYFYRKITAGETFNLEKYATTFGYIALVSVAAYIATSALPDFDSILSQVTAAGGTADTGTILALLTTVGAWVYKNVLGKISTTTTSAVTTTAASTSSVSSTATPATTSESTTTTSATVEAVTPVQESWIANANGTVTNSRTGRTYVNVAVGTADELALSKENTTSSKHTVITPNGKTFSTSFSQFWEDPEYQISLYGIPTPAIIAAYTDASYAYAVAQYTLGKTATAPAAPTVTA